MVCDYRLRFKLKSCNICKTIIQKVLKMDRKNRLKIREKITNSRYLDLQKQYPVI